MAITTPPLKCCYTCGYVLSRFDMSVSVAIEFAGEWDSATSDAAVTRPQNASGDDLLGHPLAVLGQTQEAHGVYEGSGEIELAAELAGGVVVGECVMVVVETFPCNTNTKNVTRFKGKINMSYYIM